MDAVVYVLIKGAANCAQHFDLQISEKKWVLNIAYATCLKCAGMHHFGICVNMCLVACSGVSSS